MYCKTCGSRIEDSASFCGVCGTPVKQKDEAAARSEDGRRPIDRHKVVGIAAVAIAGLLIVAIIASILSGNSWQGTVNGVVTEYYRGNIEKVVDYMPTKWMKKTLFPNDPDLAGYKSSLRVLYDAFAGSTKGTMKKYEIVSTEKLSEGSLELYSAGLGRKVADGMKVNLRVICRAEGGDAERNVELTLLKLGGDWYLAPDSISGLIGA
ncbi:MAG: zinc-ribbon domain-containing protein [Clostridia bacterium]|nr:zinc-ribbon domain-containing protein [Clostridia bacterium]